MFKHDSSSHTHAATGVCEGLGFFLLAGKKEEMETAPLYLGQRCISMLNVILLCLCYLSFRGCADSGVEPPINPLKLAVEDVSCTEAFLKLTVAEAETQRTLTLKRGDSTIATITMDGTDSLFVDEGLLPKKTYTYTLTRPATQNAQEWRATAQATTMDTTSHNWAFTVDTLGESGSYLADVAIINDTLAYAVGEIYQKDTMYNIAKWNGKKWELMRLLYNCRLYYPNCGPVTDLITPAHSIFAFGPNDIWISAGSVHHYDGKNWSQHAGILGVGNANKIWGSSSTNLWFVGGDGFIVHYNGSSWQKMESGTTHHLVDIDGNGKELYAVGINVSRDAGIVLKQKNGGWEKAIEGVDEATGFLLQQLFKTQLYGSTNGLWIDNTGTIYTVGIYMYRYKLSQWNYVKSLPENYIGGQLGYRGYLEDVNGNSSNDMFIAGQRGTLRHFNGSTWVQVGIPFNYNDDLHFWLSIDVKGNLVIAVGSMDHRARTIVLRRK